MRHLLTAIVTLATTSLLIAEDLTTLKGKKITGDLVAADDKVVTIRAGDGNVVTPVPEIFSVDFPAKSEMKLPDKYISVELVDGTMFNCHGFKLSGKSVELSIVQGLRITVPMSAVAYILTDAQDPKIQREWQRVLSDRGRMDRYFVRRDDRLDGLEGTFGEADAKGEVIPFTTASGAKRNIPLAQLSALLFNNRLEGNIPKSVCRVIDAYRNSIVAQKVQFTAGKLTVLTVGGITVEYPSLQALSRLDYSKDKIVYLSDMKPLREERIADEPVEVVARDKTLQNQPIQLEGINYSKGLVMHSHVELTFDLGGDYKEFQAMIGVDPTLPEASPAKLIIEGDGRELFAVDVKNKDRPRSLNLDVKKVRQLKIRVTADFLFGREVTLADAKVSK
jgi:hypothetical protein